MNHKIYDIKPTIIEASHDYKRNGENIEADRIIDLRLKLKKLSDKQLYKIINIEINRINETNNTG